MGKLFEIRVNKENEKVFIVLAENKKHCESFFREWMNTLLLNKYVINSITELPNFGGVTYNEPTTIIIAQ